MSTSLSKVLTNTTRPLISHNGLSSRISPNRIASQILGPQAPSSRGINIASKVGKFEQSPLCSITQKKSILVVQVNSRAFSSLHQNGLLQSSIRKRTYNPLNTTNNRAFSSESSSTKTKLHPSEIFYNIGQGISGFFGILGVLGIGSGVYTFTKEEGLNTKRVELSIKTSELNIKEATLATKESELNKNPAAKLGLIGVQRLGDRTAEDQAQMYKEAKETLTIIGISGLRMVQDTIDTKPNPIRGALGELMGRPRPVKVRLLIYNPKSPVVLGSKQHQGKVNDAILLSKKMESQFPGVFKAKMLKPETIPPFHGDLIDNHKAHIVPIRSKGLDATAKASIQTYVLDKDSDSPTNRLEDIRADFNTLWEEAEELPNQEQLPGK